MDVDKSVSFPSSKSTAHAWDCSGMIKLEWIRMFCKCFYFAGDAGHVDDKLNMYNLDQDSESSKYCKLSYF